MSYRTPGYWPGYFAPTYFGSVGIVAPVIPADFRAGLLARLKTDGELAALVGSADRIRFGASAQRDALSRVVLHLISDVRGPDLHGCAGFALARLQIHVRTQSLGESIAIKGRIEDLLDGFLGFLPGGMHVSSSRQIDESDLYEWADDGSGRFWAGIRQEFRIRHTVQVTPAP